MHKTRIYILAATLIAIALAGFMVIRAFQEPTLVASTLIFAPLFGFAAGIGARSFFISDSWYQEREKKERAWWSRHPLLEWSMVGFGVFIILFLILRHQ